jgi:KRAB domain-containing zinc finger protein
LLQVWGRPERLLVKPDLTLLAKGEEVKLEPKADSELSDQEPEGAEYGSDNQDNEEMEEVKQEPARPKPRLGKRRAGRKRRVSDSDSSGEEWAEAGGGFAKVVDKEEEGFDEDQDYNEDDEDNSIKRSGGTVRCNKCGRSKKGHKLPLHSSCQLEGVDLVGLQEVQELEAQKVVRRRLWNTKRRQRNMEEKGMSTKYYKLPCERLACDICDIEQFTTEFAVFTHVRKNHGPKEQLTCEEESCEGKTFKSHGALVYHRQQFHEEKAPCVECGTTEYTTLKNHMVSKHPRQCDPISCDQCGKVFTNKLKFKLHIKKAHTSVEERRIQASGYSGEKSKLLQTFARDCQCNLEFRNISDKLDHLKLFHLGYEQCPKCQKVVKDVNSLQHKCGRTDKKKPTGGPYICSMCGQQWKSQGGRDYHIKTYHLKETAQCPICGKNYPKAGLSNHMNSTHAPKITCNICGKSVSRIKEHMDTMHTVTKQSTILFPPTLHYSLYRTTVT